MSRKTLQDICHSVKVPVVAIGGIHSGNIQMLSGCGVDGVALVSAIFSASDIEKECKKLRSMAEEMVGIVPKKPFSIRLKSKYE